MKHLWLIFALFILTTACKKKSTVTIQAYNINNPTDGSHYAGMEYVIVESLSSLYLSKSKRVAYGVLDQNGHASVDIKMNGNRKYILSVGKPENICYREENFI